MITATEMLESMIENPRPTRAEISDIDSLAKEGRILTLSTCIGGMPYNRLLIVAAERTPDMPVSGAPAKN